MKKIAVCVVIGLIAFAVSLKSASALPPFNKEWVAKYNPGEANATFKDAKCNVCHAGESKKMKNEYGKAVGKYLTKAKYNEIKDDQAAAQKYIAEGLQKAEGEKSSSGQTYGELIKAGKLPGGA
jgi:hypothetical protein